MTPFRTSPGMRILVPALALMLAGCATTTPAERAARMQKEVDEMIQVYGPACEKLGFHADTDPWRNCILRLNTDKTREFQASRASTTTHCWGHRGFFECSSF